MIKIIENLNGKMNMDENIYLEVAEMVGRVVIEKQKAYYNRTLHRIKSLQDFNDVKYGDLKCSFRWQASK